MEKRGGFIRFTLNEFKTWLDQLKVARTIRTVQQHHTYLPRYEHFKGNNHFKIQTGMKNYHVHSNGWQDIGQHFTSFPDGTIVTGRSLEKSPACIYGFNANSICIEHLGNFDKGHDQMTNAQKATAAEMTAAICDKFNIPITTEKIVYHHWFNLSTGKRNDGSGGNKSCPGTNFFGGNKVKDAENNFLPLVIKALLNDEDDSVVETNPILLKYVSVTASKLNIRTGPGVKNAKALDRHPALFSAILRVYDVKDNWYKISSSAEHWVSARYTKDVQLGTVTASKLNIRSGPGVDFPKVGAYKNGADIWIHNVKSDWYRVSHGEEWVSKKYVQLEA